VFSNAFDLLDELSILQKYLERFVLPRRVVNASSSKRLSNNKNEKVYRRVTLDENNRGELFPVWTAGLQTFAQFGVGVGIYFLQLLILCLVFFVSGMIMLSAVDAYKSNHYGVTRQDPLLTISAACDSPVNVTATINCPDDAPSCLILMRPHCELPTHAAFADLAMSLFFLASIYLARFGEKWVEEQLDEAVQTAQDYSLQVFSSLLECLLYEQILTLCFMF
jgi:hypothetical protein